MFYNSVVCFLEYSYGNENISRLSVSRVPLVDARPETGATRTLIE